MRIGNRQIKGPNQEIIAIPRYDGDIILIAKAVLNWDTFNKACIEPKPPTVITPKGGKQPNINDPKYVAALDHYGEQRLAWLILESLRDTPDLVWETVKLDDPNTWVNYKKEFQDSGLTPTEVGRIIQGVMIANALNEEKIEQARSRFLALREQGQNELSSQNGEQKITPSGELANAGK